MPSLMWSFSRASPKRPVERLTLKGSPEHPRTNEPAAITAIDAA
jgi:hypothetical protein